MTKTRTTVGGTVVLPGYHYWPDAPKGRAYLASRHRHLFHITPEVAVNHDDRDVEFHDLRDIVTEWWQPEQGGSSCEAMAHKLGQELEARGLDVASVTVSEDGVDFATVRFDMSDVPR